jgi:hypothetical protein
LWDVSDFRVAVDMTMHASLDSGVTSGTNVSQESLPDAASATEDVSNLGDEERGLAVALDLYPSSPGPVHQAVLLSQRVKLSYKHGPTR